MSAYPPLPRAPEPLAFTSPHEYGAALLRYVIETGITCTIPDAGLEWALQVATLSLHLGSDQPDDTREARQLRAQTRETTVRARRELVGAIDRRRRLNATPPPASVPTAPTQAPAGGQRVPLVTPPSTRPPAGQLQTPPRGLDPVQYARVMAPTRSRPSDDEF